MNPSTPNQNLMSHPSIAGLGTSSSYAQPAGQVTAANDGETALNIYNFARTEGSLSSSSATSLAYDSSTYETTSDTSVEEHAFWSAGSTETSLSLRQKDDSAIDDAAAPVPGGKESRSHRGELEDAPPSTSDMPWHAMDGISSKELIAFFPNHVGKWPAAAARLIEDGYSTKEITDNVNRSRMVEGQKQTPVLANTLGVSINKVCKQFYDQSDFKAQDHRTVMSNRTPDAIEAIKQLVASKKWMPTSISRHSFTLTPAWSLTQIAQHYIINKKPFPCDGLFTQHLTSELKGTLSADSLKGCNPPKLPLNWAPANIADRGSKGKAKRVFSDLTDEQTTVSKRTKTTEARNTTGSDKLASRGKRVNPADLPQNHEEFIKISSHLLSGEVLLDMISKKGGKMTMATLCEKLRQNPNTKSVNDSTLRHRKATALRERALARGTTFEIESALFNSEEAYTAGDDDDQPRQRASSKPTGPTRVQPRRATRSAATLYNEEEEADDGICPEALLPATSYPGVDCQPGQTPTFSYNGQIMEEVEPLSTPELHASIEKFLAENPGNGTSAAPTSYSGAGLGLDLGTEQSHIYTHAQSYETVFGQAGSIAPALLSNPALAPATGSAMVFGDTVMMDFTPHIPNDLPTFPDGSQEPGSNTFHSGFTDEFKANNGVFSPLPPNLSSDGFEFHSGFTPLPGEEAPATFEEFQELPSSNIFTFHNGNTPELRANNAIFEAMLQDTHNNDGLHEPMNGAHNATPQTFFYGMNYSSTKLAGEVTEDNDVSMSDDNEEGSLHAHVLAELEKSVFDRYVNTSEEE